MPNKKVKIICNLCHEERLIDIYQFAKRKTDNCHRCSLLSRIKKLQEGIQFNKWIVIEDLLNSFVLCKCECGTIRKVDKYTLISGSSQSCGCISTQLNKNRTKLLINGDKYGLLTVIDKSIISGKSICKCECGKLGEYENSNLLNGNTKSCGCLRKINAYHGKRKSGSEHHNWKGGISEERHLYSISLENKNWRTSVFERDNYICQKCGQWGGVLNAHHILSYFNHIDLRSDINNGITLCNKCHREVHKKEGKPKSKHKLKLYKI